MLANGLSEESVLVNGLSEKSVSEVVRQQHKKCVLCECETILEMVMKNGGEYEVSVTYVIEENVTVVSGMSEVNQNGENKNEANESLVNENGVNENGVNEMNEKCVILYVLKLKTFRLFWFR